MAFINSPKCHLVWEYPAAIQVPLPADVWTHVKSEVQAFDPLLAGKQTFPVVRALESMSVSYTTTKLRNDYGYKGPRAFEHCILDPGGAPFVERSRNMSRYSPYTNPTYQFRIG